MPARFHSLNLQNMPYRTTQTTQWPAPAPIQPSLSIGTLSTPPPLLSPGPYSYPQHQPRPAGNASQITPRIFISDLSFAENAISLSSHGITHILSVLPDKILIPAHPSAPSHRASSASAGPSRRLQIPIEDAPFAELAGHLPTTTGWIDTALRSDPDARVLVHCGEGISRSVSVVAAFLMAQYHYTPEQAIDFIQAKRAVANPNRGFRDQLREYAGMLRQTAARC